MWQKAKYTVKGITAKYMGSGLKEADVFNRSYVIFFLTYKIIPVHGCKIQCVRT